MTACHKSQSIWSSALVDSDIAAGTGSASLFTSACAVPGRDCRVPSLSRILRKFSLKLSVPFSNSSFSCKSAFEMHSLFASILANNNSLLRIVDVVVVEELLKMDALVARLLFGISLGVTGSFDVDARLSQLNGERRTGVGFS